MNFLKYYGADGNDTIVVQGKDGAFNIRTVAQLFTQCLDLFGRPSKRFYEHVAAWAKNPAEKARLRWIIGSEGAEEFKSRVEDTVTYASLLREFSSARPSMEELMRAIPAIKPRHYSIASSSTKLKRFFLLC